MDLRTLVKHIGGKRRIIYCQLRGWDVKDSALFYALLQYVKNCCIFVDGSIAGGKTTFIQYLENQVAAAPAYDRDGLEDMKIFPEPIDEVRKVTELYYGKKCSLDEANSKIASLCTDPWTKSLSTYVGGTYMIERLPPPFRSWVFENGFTTTYEVEKEKTIELVKNKKILGEYLASHKIDDTLAVYEKSLEKFRNIMVVLVCPPVSKILRQISERGREEEGVITIGYMKYLASKFERVAWEIFDRSDNDDAEEIAKTFPR